MAKQNDDEMDWAFPCVTPNSAMLAGYIMGALMRDDLYRATEVKTETGEITVECVPTGNSYRVRVEQIGGKL